MGAYGNKRPALSFLQETGVQLPGAHQKGGEMSNKEAYEMAIAYLEKHFGRGAYSASDAIELAVFLKPGV
jgi:hypothetical protein